MFMLETSFV